MANHKSAIKRIRSNDAKRVLNRYQEKTGRNSVKALKEIKDKKAAKEMLPKVIAMVDKLAKKNVLHRNKASHLKSQLTKHVNALTK